MFYLKFGVNFKAMALSILKDTAILREKLKFESSSIIKNKNKKVKNCFSKKKKKKIKELKIQIILLLHI